MIALVTGAGGFLGVKLAQRLLEAGHQVVAVDRVPSPCSLQGNSAVRWVECDLECETLDPELFDGVETVFHLAGATLGAGKDERLFLQANEATTVGLLKGCAGRVPRLVHASSQVVYGDVNSLAVDEGFPLHGFDSAYATSKVNAENWLRWFHCHGGGHYVALRFSGFIEGGGSIDYMVDQALAGLPIELFSRGEICRDYLPVRHGIEALVRSAALPHRELFEAFNIGSGQAVTTAALARIVCEEARSDSPVVPVDRVAPRANFVYDISKARAMLGFEPGSLADEVRSYVRSRINKEAL